MAVPALTHALGEPPWVCFLCYVLLRIPLFWEEGLAGPGGEVTPYCPMSPSALLILEAGLSVCPVTASARPFLLFLPQTWGGAGVLLMPKALWPQPGFSEDTVSGLWLPWNLVIPFSI